MNVQKLTEVDTELWQAGLSGLAERGTQEHPLPYEA